MTLPNYAHLSTEQSNPRSRNLDRFSALQIIRLMNNEDRRVLQAVRQSQRPIARAVDLVVRNLSDGGRLFFVGAGTSGRLGVIEAAECPPTFNTPPGLVRAIMAGGRNAVFKSKEGAEDSEREAGVAIRKARIGTRDVVVGIAASGVTSFVRAALQQSRSRRASTVFLTCNPKSYIPGTDVTIVLNTGPEVLSGSTRLKAGTACKMALNMLTTASMVRLGKVYGNWMVDLQPKSRKLVARGVRLTGRLGGVSGPKAQRLFQRSGGQVKVAIAMARRGFNRAQAVRALAQHNGLLREVIR